MLDIQVLAWLASNRKQLRERERRAIADHADRLVISVISIWELRLKWWKSSRRAAAEHLVRPDDAVAFCARTAITIIPFTAEDAMTALQPPIPHNDPFDEMLLVQAQRNDARLLTRDDNMIGHPLAYHP